MKTNISYIKEALSVAIQDVTFTYPDQSSEYLIEQANNFLDLTLECLLDRRRSFNVQDVIANCITIYSKDVYVEAKYYYAYIGEEIKNDLLSAVGKTYQIKDLIIKGITRYYLKIFSENIVNITAYRIYNAFYNDINNIDICSIPKIKYKEAQDICDSLVKDLKAYEIHPTNENVGIFKIIYKHNNQLERLGEQDGAHL